MRGIRSAIFVLALVAVFLLPVTCICSLMQIPGLYAPAPHLNLFGHNHEAIASSAASAPDMLAMLGMTMNANKSPDLSMEMGDDNAPAADRVPPISSNNSGGDSLSGHGSFVDITPMLLATLPSALIFVADGKRQPRWGQDNQVAQFSPLPITPPPPALI